VAQLEAQATCNRQVVGSSPTTGSDKLPVQRLIAVSANTPMVPLSQQSSQQLEAEALPGSMREKRSGEASSQCREVFRSSNLSPLVLPVSLVKSESSCNVSWITGRTVRPNSECSFEVEFDHDSAEIEQQGTNWRVVNWRAGAHRASLACPSTPVLCPASWRLAAWTTSGLRDRPPAEDSRRPRSRS